MCEATTSSMCLGLIHTRCMGKHYITKVNGPEEEGGRYPSPPFTLSLSGCSKFTFQCFNPPVSCADDGPNFTKCMQNKHVGLRKMSLTLKKPDIESFLFKTPHSLQKLPKLTEDGRCCIQNYQLLAKS